MIKVMLKGKPTTSTTPSDYVIGEYSMLSIKDRMRVGITLTTSITEDAGDRDWLRIAKPHGFGYAPAFASYITPSEWSITASSILRSLFRIPFSIIETAPLDIELTETYSNSPFAEESFKVKVSVDATNIYIDVFMWEVLNIVGSDVFYFRGAYDFIVDFILFNERIEALT